MTKELCFWILMLLMLVLGGWNNRKNCSGAIYDLMIFLLFLLLGWQVFGKPVH